MTISTYLCLHLGFAYHKFLLVAQYTFPGSLVWLLMLKGLLWSFTQQLIVIATLFICGHSFLFCYSPIKHRSFRIIHQYPIIFVSSNIILRCERSKRNSTTPELIISVLYYNLRIYLLLIKGAPSKGIEPTSLFTQAPLLHCQW
jgi:hypothetical protein